MLLWNGRGAWCAMCVPCSAFRHGSGDFGGYGQLAQGAVGKVHVDSGADSFYNEVTFYFEEPT